MTKTSSISPGFGFLSARQQRERVGWCDQHYGKEKPPKRKLPKIPFYLRDLRSSCLTLFGRDEFVATAHKNTVTVLRFHDVMQASNADDRESGAVPEPVMTVELPDEITHLEARNGRRPFDLVAALADGTLWIVDFSGPPSKRGAARMIGFSEEPKQRQLASIGKDPVKNIFNTRSRVMVETQVKDGSAHKLHDIDLRSGRVTRSADLPFNNLISLSPLQPSRSDALVAIDSSHEAYLVDFAHGTDAKESIVTPFQNIPRVTAAMVFSNRYLVVALKGGQVVKVEFTPTAASAPEYSDALARACRLLCGLLKLCQCDCCEGGPEDKPRDDDDEPCDERHVVQLGWTAKSFHAMQSYIVAFSAGRQRMAVLDNQLNVLFERYLGRRGVAIAPGQTTTDRMLLYRGGVPSLEAWALADYVRHLQGLDPEAFSPTWPPNFTAPASTRTYFGQKRANPRANPLLRVAVFTVTEPGQAFTDPNQGKLQAQIEPQVFDVVNDYYVENSFGDLDVQFSVFGVDFGGVRKPLVLPQPVAVPRSLFQKILGLIDDLRRRPVPA